MKLEYPVNIKKTEETFLVTFVDFPEIITFGDTMKEAREKAIDGLDCMLGFLLKEDYKIPLPSLPMKMLVVSPSPDIEKKLVDFIIRRK